MQDYPTQPLDLIPSSDALVTPTAIPARRLGRKPSEARCPVATAQIVTGALIRAIDLTQDIHRAGFPLFKPRLQAQSGTVHTLTTAATVLAQPLNRCTRATQLPARMHVLITETRQPQREGSIHRRPPLPTRTLPRQPG
eukprot:m.399844 g.399844  ORF g.399844 m.399844 type:complete len:139 (+) comp28382_c0_seq10:3998-4414(+)